MGAKYGSYLHAYIHTEYAVTEKIGFLAAGLPHYLTYGLTVITVNI